MAKKQIVVGFLLEEYELYELNQMTDRQKHELALSDDSCYIVDNVSDWFNDLNNDFIDTENVYWFCINID